MKQLLPESWARHLQGELESGYMSELFAFLEQRKATGKTICPGRDHWFSAFQETPFESVKVVILGQDPYHGAGQAHGLCFSVQAGFRIPPSLRNIYRELASDIDFQPPEHGCLSCWAQAGVLLLNSTLTVEEKNPGSHQEQGWERFTDAAIRALNEQRQGLVFMLWGNFAQSKAALIDVNRHLVLKTSHPSPLSARRGFSGFRHFSRANDYLTARADAPVDWSLE